ncbi:MAG TPA: hypothetical protein VD837_17315 [Terriglobales bacterium]|nr:hypothetical protein [Terriglobales bacterium]
MPDTSARYILSIQSEHFHRGMRFHWIVCTAQNPDTLVSWGHAPSRELAEAAAQDEIEDLRSGRTPGGRVGGGKKMNIRLR